MVAEMKPRRPRFTIRGIMALVVLIALGLYLGIAAVEVYREKERHVHMAVKATGNPDVTAIVGKEPPFWPRYFLRVLGRTWRGRPYCGTTPVFTAEQCEFAYHEMTSRARNALEYLSGPVQAQKINEILRQQAELQKLKN